jgi:hypothetical protein
MILLLFTTLQVFTADPPVRASWLSCLVDVTVCVCARSLPLLCPDVELRLAVFLQICGNIPNVTKINAVAVFWIVDASGNDQHAIECCQLSTIEMARGSNECLMFLHRKWRWNAK